MKRRILIFQLILVFVFSTMSLTPGMLINVSAAGEVCEINGTLYATLDDALAAVTDGQSIKLLDNITDSDGISITNGKTFTIDLNSYTLTATNNSGIGLVVRNSSVDLTGNGAFNVDGDLRGVYADNATVTVSSVASSSGDAAYAENGGEITVNGDAAGYTTGAYAAGAGSSVSVSGDATANRTGSRGAEASSGGSITIGGNAQGSNAGAYAHGADSTITVTGNATGTDVNSYGVFADAGTIVIGGNAKANGNGATSIGARASREGNVTINGDVQGLHLGVYADGENSIVVVKNNVMATADDGVGALAQGGGEITIDGAITAVIYIEVNAVKTIIDKEANTTKNGYNTYSDGLNTVWVKATASYVAEIGSAQYFTLDEALGEVANEQTIKLLADITDSNGISITSGKTFVIDLNGHTLDVTNTGDLAKGLEVTNHSCVNIDDSVAGSAFNVFSNTYGVYVDNATVTVSTATASDGTAVIADNNANVTVTGNAEGASGGVFSRNSRVTVNGDVESTQDGVAAVTSQSSTVLVHGNVIARGGSSSYGVLGHGNVTVDGNVEGCQVGAEVDGDFSVVNIGGNVTARGTDEGDNFHCYGALASGGNINIGGNIVALGGTGVRGVGSGKATIEGTISAANYLEFAFGGVNTVKTIDDKKPITTKSGYDTYENNFSSVWVKTIVSFVAEISGTQYVTLDDALAAVPAGVASATTIKLLKNINYSSGIVVDRKNVTFDVGSYTLNVTNTSDAGLYVCNGGIVSLLYTTGKFNVTGTTCGVSADGAGSELTVTNATATVNTGAYASNRGKITVLDSVVGVTKGAEAHSGCQIDITNNVTATGTDNFSIAANAVATTGSATIHIGGNATGYRNGVSAASSGGNIGSVTVAGNVATTSQENLSQEDGVCVVVRTGGKVTIDGTISGVKYIQADGVLKTAADLVPSITKPGYKEFTNLVHTTVWVKASTTDVCQIVSTGYATLDDALTAVINGQTIKLLEDVSHASKIEAVNKSFIIDVNGFKLTVNVSGDNCVSAVNGQSITINDTASGGSFEVNGSGKKDGFGINGLYADGIASAINVNVPATINVTGESNIGVRAIRKGVVDAELTDINNSAGLGYVTGLMVYEGGTAHVRNIYVKHTGLWCIGVYMYGDVNSDGQTSATVDGAITADEYIRMVPSTLEIEDATIPTTKAGYRTYKMDGAANANTVWVKIPSMTDAEKVAADKAALTFDVIKNQNTLSSNITGSLATLPTSGANGSVISWLSSDPSTISSSGAVTRPTNGTGDKMVTLTATITSGAASDTVVFSLVVKEMAQAADATLPSWPGGSLLTSSNVTQTGLTLTWSAATDNIGVTGYKILKDGIPYVTVGNILTTNITGLTAGTQYIFKTEACDAAGNWSSTGPSVTITTALANALPDGNGRDSGGGGGSGTASVPAPKPEAQVLDSNGNISRTATIKLDSSTGTAAVNIDSTSLTGAFDKSNADNNGVKTIKIDIPEIVGAKAYEPVLPASFLTSGDAMKAVEIKTGIAAVTVSGNILQAANAAAAHNVSLTIAAVDKSKLSTEVQAQIGSRPVIELNLRIDGKTTSWSNESAPVKVSIPYTPTAEELKDPEHITVWYVDGSGKLIAVPSGRYDIATGKVTFSTTHFSKYTVAFAQKTFNDLGSVDWAQNPIEVLASKGVLRGISENEYAPSFNITRADFLYYLVRTLGVDAKVDGNFEDISSDAYYYREIGIAKKLGITSGMGNNKFNPDASITRQDMMVLTERALRMLKMLKQQDTVMELEKFSDKSRIAAYASGSVASLVKEGLILGSGDNINPLGNTSRAEAAVFLYRIYNKY